ncbi:MAG: hypothetical protein ACRDS0_08035 [Pseudonocardiaceae bacterium]
MTNGTIGRCPRTVAHAFAELMNGHDPDAVETFVAENYVNHNAVVEDGEPFWVSRRPVGPW